MTSRQNLIRAVGFLLVLVLAAVLAPAAQVLPELTVRIKGAAGTVTLSPLGIGASNKPCTFGSDCRAKYRPNAQVRLKAPGVIPPSGGQGGAIFTGWGGDCAGPGVGNYTVGGECTLTMSRSRQVVARFKRMPQIKVEIRAVGPGERAVGVRGTDGRIKLCRSDKSPCWFSFAPNEVVRVQAEGQTFAGWAGDAPIVDSPGFVFQMGQKDVNLKARFSPAPPAPSTPAPSTKVGYDLKKPKKQ